MQIIEENVSLRTTADCITLLVAKIGGRKWKRVAKISIHEGEVRTFKDELDRYATIVSDDEYGARIFVNLNFGNLHEIVKEIKRLSGFYFTWDYGELFFNPCTMELWVVGSDGGYGYSKLPLSRITQLIEDDEYDFEAEGKNFVDFNDHESLKEITKVTWEAEYYPTSDDDTDLSWIQLCTINLID